jgi:hypothetical protein
MSFTSTKPVYNSLTVRASFLAILASGFQLFGVQLAPDVIPNLNAIITGVSAAVAIYGRARAKTIIA